MTQAAQLAQYGASSVGLSFKNRIINGNMTIDQRFAGAAVTINSTADTYSIDRWYGLGQPTDGVFTIQRNAGSVTPPAGFINYLGATVTTADASIGATQVYRITQAIEGLNCTDLAWGTANAKTVTLSFWVRSSLTGTFGGSIANSNFSRAYPYSYTISSANTWEYKTVTIAGDTTGTWLTTNGVGIYVSFAMGMGSTYTGTANAWNAGLYFAPTGNTNIIGTNGATFYITGVQLEVGSTATSFDYRPYGTELALCQRYFYKTIGSDVYSVLTAAGQGVSTTSAVLTVPTKVTMRTAPALATTGNLCVTSNGLNGVTAVTSIAIYSRCTAEIPMVSAAVASGLTAGTCYFLHGANDATASLLLSSEL
jgi:hypothetical protein